MTLSAGSDPVAGYLEALEHPRAAEAATLCDLIRELCPGYRAGIKWNAPSFGPVGAEDCLTLRLHPAPAFQLVLHRGAKPHPEASPHPKTPKGLVLWRAPDRGVVDFANRPLALVLSDLTALIRAWVVS